MAATPISVTSTIRYRPAGTDLGEVSGFGDLVLNNATITASGQSQLPSGIASGGLNNAYNVPGARQVDLLITVANAPTGTNPTLQFEIDVINVDDTQAAFGVYNSLGTIQSYKGAVIAAQGTDVITIANNPIGDFIQVKWTIGGTSSPTFTGVSARLVWKK